MPAKPARRLSGWKPESVVSLNDENDDEAERANAANSKREEAEKRQAAVKSVVIGAVRWQSSLVSISAARWRSR